MRKLSFGLLAVAMAAVVFTSCKKEENAAPVVSFTNIADSISTLEVTADNYDLTIQVTSEAGLKEVKISETKNGTTTDKETITTFENGADFTKVYKVSGIPTAGMDVTVSATDKDDQNTTRKISLKKKDVPVIADLTSVTFADENGANFIGAGGSSYGSYVDLDGGKIYHSASLTAHKAEVDAVFNLTSLYDEGTGLTGKTGTLFGTTTLNETTFGTAKEDALTGLTASLSTIELTQGKVIYFANASHKGLILIKTLTAATTGTANDAKITIEVKMK